VDAGPKGVVLAFRKNTFSAPEKLLAYITKNPTKAKLRPDHKLFLGREFPDEAAKLNGVREAVEVLAGLV
jgi:transcription-repair coupling factor (superfamily II helicase)